MFFNREEGSRFCELHMLRQGLAFVVIVMTLCVSSHAQVVMPEGSIQVEMVDVDASSAFVAIASGLRVPIIVGPFVKQRISVSGTYRSGQELIEQMAKQVNAVLIQRGDIRIVRAGCMPAATTPSIASKEEAPLSLYFQNVDLKMLSELLEWSLFGSVSSIKDWQRQTISMTLTDLPRGDVEEAIAFASGIVRIVPESYEKDKLTRLQISSGCAADSSPRSETALKWPRRTAPLATNCPYRVMGVGEGVGENRRRRCGYLEFFALHMLHPRGFIHLNDKYLALIESPDEILTIASVGDYLGQDFGRINAISSDGIKLKEIVPDANNEWHEVLSTLKFGVRPSPTPSSMYEHGEVGSPQRRYVAALGSLFTATSFTAEFAEVCMHQFPSNVAPITAALSAWKGQNSRVLAEIDKHFAAYIVLKSQILVVSAATLENKYKGEVSKGISSQVKQMGGLSSDHMLNHCRSYPLILKQAESDMEKRYAGELDVIRACEATATCPNLQFNRFEN